MGKQDEDWKSLKEAWNKVDKSHNWYSRLLTWWSENKHDQKIVLEKITALRNQSNCPTSLQKWIFKSATTSTKTTATSEPARSSKTIATTQPPTSSNNVEQAKEVEVEELPSKPPTSANTPVQNRLKSEIADLNLKIKKLQDFVSTGFAKDDQKHELHQDRLKLKELTQKLNQAENLRKAQQKLREKKKLEAPQTLPNITKFGRPPIEKEQEGFQEAILNRTRGHTLLRGSNKAHSGFGGVARTTSCKRAFSLTTKLVEDGFLPAPVMFRHGLYGLEACSQENMDGRFLDISQRLQNAFLVPVKPCPNDYYCPSVIPELQKLICPVCKKYFFRKASLTKHGKIHKNLATIFELAEEEIETEVVSSIDEGGVQIIEDMEAWMQPIYEDDTGN
ncbi:hypothetical protein ILUMI_13550 [Ignelater luminosus]|uniref:C2H2-type domain-containing protein n=1 Tax=Ignelater luminosus TaxID=2038154 RepID=A0A8K0CXK9_IGNLU|nr:hypothetical protein ILUMI_13550 [Ignelater luminosus]